MGVWGLAPIIKLTPSDHRLLKNRAQSAVASTKNSPRGVPRSGGLGDEIPHKNKIVSRETFLQTIALIGF